MLFSDAPETVPLNNRVGTIRASKRGARHFLDHATSGHQKEHRESSHEDTPLHVHSLGQLLHDASLSPSGLVRSCCAGTVGRPGRSILKRRSSPYAGCVGENFSFLQAGLISLGVISSARQSRTRDTSSPGAPLPPCGSCSTWPHNPGAQPGKRSWRRLTAAHTDRFPD